ncbi:hypothetical protein LCGC14_0377010 [marine sediment metagenome]|uniref:Uncharacterized protein n=1 Tax=marine sediment metagenome TaxID=412755 RepID=A0A0F9T3L3_9ZZZZ
MAVLSKTRIQKYIIGIYHVYYGDERIGIVRGARRSWLAETYDMSYSGYHETRALAVVAVREHYIAQSL